MKTCIGLYVFYFTWVTMSLGGLHASAGLLSAQHEPFDATTIQKWKDYEAFSRSLQGIIRSQGIRNGKPYESIKRFKQNRECTLYLEPHNRESSLLICTLTNPRYKATLDLSKIDLSNAILRNYTPVSSEAENLSSIDGFFYVTSRHFAYGQSSRLRQVVSDPFFKMTKNAKEIQNGQELIRVDYIFNYVRPGSNKDAHVRAQGSLWLDPSRCWCIRRLKTTSESTTRGERIGVAEMEEVYETTDHPSGFPILKSRTDYFRIVNSKNKRTSEGTTKTDYELEVNDSVPNSEFTLSAFGLPEPGSEAVKKPIPLFIWILVAAGVCAVLALGFRYLARRARAKPLE